MTQCVVWYKFWGAIMRYYILKCTICDGDLSEESYGIMVLSDDNSREYFCDISDSFDSMNMFVEKLNEFHIEPCHLKSVIEDYKFTTENAT